MAPLFNWLKTRGAGVLLHPTCLPGAQGCGVFDEHTVRFLDFLKAGGMKYWQVCPLGPTRYGDSPYQCFSAFARHPYLLDLPLLVPFGPWARVRAAAKERGVEIIGDLPIFVAGDSADAWASPHLFELDPKTLLPLAVAGVPPDYFSADGQLWGNPLYRWPAHRADGYGWWLARMRASFEMCDIVRIDHFRGFDSYWRIPLPAKNARVGEWVPGPGLDLFPALRPEFPAARIIAEDLGVLTDSVTKLRDSSGLPGMLVLQFAWGSDAKNNYLPHNATPNSVIYPGTHDNDTTAGWYLAAPEAERDYVRRYLRVSGTDVAWDFIRAGYGSASRLAVISLQDIFGLGSTARFNTPSTAGGNWQWRYRAVALAKSFSSTAKYLQELAQLYGR